MIKERGVLYSPQNNIKNMNMKEENSNCDKSILEDIKEFFMNFLTFPKRRMEEIKNTKFATFDNFYDALAFWIFSVIVLWLGPLFIIFGYSYWLITDTLSALGFLAFMGGGIFVTIIIPYILYKRWNKND